MGEYGLFAAYTYLVGGGHAFDESGVPITQQERTSKGIVLGKRVWLGTGAKVLDGVTLGGRRRDRRRRGGRQGPAGGAIAAGVPARVLRRRAEGAEPAGSRIESP